MQVWLLGDFSKSGGGNRSDIVTDWALEQFRTHYKDKKIGKWDIFYYVYGLLHHPGYRTKFADNLKRELPRIPFAADFWAFAKAGKELARLHLDYEKLEPYPLKWIETPGVPLSYRVEDKMRLAKDKTSLKVNPSLTLAPKRPEPRHQRGIHRAPGGSGGAREPGDGEDRGGAAGEVCRVRAMPPLVVVDILRHRRHAAAQFEFHQKTSRKGAKAQWKTGGFAGGLRRRCMGLVALQNRPFAHEKGSSCTQPALSDPQMAAR